MCVCVCGSTDEMRRLNEKASNFRDLAVAAIPKIAEGVYWSIQNGKDGFGECKAPAMGKTNCFMVCVIRNCVLWILVMRCDFLGFTILEWNVFGMKGIMGISSGNQFLYKGFEKEVYLL